MSARRFRARPGVALLGLALVRFGAIASWRIGTAAEPAPRVVVTAPLGGQTSERVVTITGRVEGLAVERLTLVVNGVPMSVPVQDGGFSQPHASHVTR